MKIKGLTDFYWRDWRLQIQYPSFDFESNLRNLYRGKNVNVDVGFAADALAFRFKRIYKINTDGSTYSYFSAGLIIFVGIAIDYLAGRGEVRKSIEQNSKDKKQEKIFKQIFGSSAR